VDDSSTRVRDGLSSVTRGTLFLLVATLLFVALSFVWRVVVVRSITPEQWSAFSWALTLAGLLSAFGTLGLPSAIARSIPYAPTDEERRSMVRGTVLVSAIAGTAVTLVLWLIGPLIGSRLGDSDIGVSLQFFSLAVGTTIAANLLASIFQGYEVVTPNALFIQILNPLLFVAFLGLAYLPSHGLTFPEALAGYTGACAATLVLVAVYALRRLPHYLPPGPAQPGAFPKLLRFAVPLFIAGILTSVTGSGDTIILGLYRLSEVANYTVSLTLARLLAIGIGAAGYIFLPVSTKFFRRGETQSVGMIYATVTKWMLLFSLPLFLVFFFLPSGSLAFVYGGRYAAVIAPLQVVVLGGFVATVLGPSTAAQVAFGQTRLVAYNSLAAALTDVGLSLYLVPAYGAVGAGVAWAAANVVVAGLGVFELGLLTGVHPFHMHVLVPLFFSGVPVGLVLGVLHPTLPFWALPLLAVGVAVLFVLSVFATRSIDRGDELFLQAVEALIGRRVPLVRRLGRRLPPPVPSRGLRP
jgi:O-antigen/teichoic acid export membrane protein